MQPMSLVGRLHGTVDASKNPRLTIQTTRGFPKNDGDAVF